MIPAKRLITKANPFVTDRFVAYEGDTISSHVSLAVWLVDEFTGKPAIADLTVSLKEINQKPIKNPSGYYCFTDLNDGDYTIVVKPTVPLANLYFHKEVKITVPMPNKLEPVKEIILKPTLSYPFPSYTTLIRGFVVETIGGKTEPIINVPVYRLMPGNKKDVETTTDRNGEYALYLRKLAVPAGQAGMEVIVEAETNGRKKRRGARLFRKKGKAVHSALISSLQHNYPCIT